MGNPLQFSLGEVEDNSDLKHYFLDHFDHMKINLLPLKQKIQILGNPFLKSVKSSATPLDIFRQNHVFLMNFFYF